MPIRIYTGGQKVRGSSQRNLSTLASIGAFWNAYWKLALGILLVTLLVAFVVQNSKSIHVRFLVWDASLPQALVVFLALLSGVLFGVAFNRWRRWRSPRRSGP